MANTGHTQSLASLSHGFQCRPCKVLVQQLAESGQRILPTVGEQRKKLYIPVMEKCNETLQHLGKPKIMDYTSMITNVY